MWLTAILITIAAIVVALVAAPAYAAWSRTPAQSLAPISFADQLDAQGVLHWTSADSDKIATYRTTVMSLGNYTSGTSTEPSVHITPRQLDTAIVLVTVQGIGKQPGVVTPRAHFTIKRNH